MDSQLLIGNDEEQEEELENDPFVSFIDYAKSILSENATDLDEDSDSVGWSWISNRILKTCVSYSSGVTTAILLSDLFLAWNEQNKVGAPKKQSEIVIKLKKKHKRAKLANTVTIDSIYEKKFLSLSSVIEAVILDAFTLSGTNIYMLTLGDIWSSHTIDLYLHRRFYNIADPKNGILIKGREVLLTGCYLRPTTANSGRACLLPTEYIVVLLDEDEDDDAMLLAAQFCSDSFSSISLDAAINGTSYSFYARIEHIGSLEILGRDGTLQRKQIKLVDNDGVSLNFLLWGEQSLVANLFSVGSFLALDRPFISNAIDSSTETSEIFLEYGSSTKLYLVPLTLQKEQLYVADVRDKMTGISLYGTVTDVKTSEIMFSLRIEDSTGSIWVKLHFDKYWSLGRLGIGHTVCISGLSSSFTPHKSIELSWHENDKGASFFNISCMPAFLSTSCLHRLIRLSDLSSHASGTKVCRVWLDQIEHCHVDTRSLHTICGNLIDKAPRGKLECKFCHSICNGEVELSFNLRITIADNTAKVFAWCIGQTAAELLQISPDEFSELPEEEQMMYPLSLEHEKFIVAIVNCRKHHGSGGRFSERDQRMVVDWEITRAIKCE